MALGGDRVRARTANASTVEGVLVLCHVPTLDHVQVLVDGQDGGVAPIPNLRQAFRRLGLLPDDRR